jgi:hypothetical protein
LHKGIILDRYTDSFIATQINQNSSSLSRLKKGNPEKYQMIRLGCYLYNENISEEELLALLEIYSKMKKSIAEKITRN